MNKDDMCPECDGDGWIAAEDGEQVRCPLCNTLEPPELPPDFRLPIKRVEGEKKSAERRPKGRMPTD